MVNGALVVIFSGGQHRKTVSTWALCAAAHNAHYAELRIMPTSVRSVLVSEGDRVGLVRIIPALRGMRGAGRMTGSGRALVGSRQSGSALCSSRAGRCAGRYGWAGSTVERSRRSPWRTVHDCSSSSAAREQPHAAGIMKTRLARLTPLTSTDRTEVGIIRSSA